MELIHTINWRRFKLHSNDMKFEKSILEKNYSYKHNCYKNSQIKSACKGLNKIGV